MIAALSLCSKSISAKMPFWTLAEEVEEEEEVVVEQEEEEEPVYVKPAPQPKAESMSLRPGLSWMLVLLVISGGIFLWRRRSKNRPATQDEIEEVLIRTTQELPQENPPLDGVAEASEARTPASATPDLVKDLTEQDALFGVEREVQIETHPAGEEMKGTPQDVLPPETALPAPSASAPVIQTPPAPDVPTVEKTQAETYYADLEHKDGMFKDERMSESVTGEGHIPEFVSASLISNPQNPATAKLELHCMEKKPATKELEQELSERLLVSPVSQNDEGSNQSAATHFSGALSPSPESTAKTSPEEEDYDFEYIPKKYDVTDEDLGPPIKPTAVDFTMPSPWEEGREKTPSEEKLHTMQYLLSNSELLTEALKLMESGNVAVNERDLLPKVPEGKPKTSKKKKKKSSKKKTTVTSQS